MALLHVNRDPAPQGFRALGMVFSRRGFAHAKSRSREGAKGIRSREGAKPRREFAHAKSRGREGLLKRHARGS
jgi:hypothetical protein